ncbi:KxYKxGKxW signal peptide domain-containing protein, partial [Limosilactobacillus coleohominis]|nr:KxYKxGKxW signal peptide domain-containing protein [Limosilactobacillus coleohominis]
MLKLRFKLYKSGKKWCCMAITAMAVMCSGFALHQTVHADTVT